jgi:hypothetical protein
MVIFLFITITTFELHFYFRIVITVSTFRMNILPLYTFQYSLKSLTSIFLFGTSTSLTVPLIQTNWGNLVCEASSSSDWLVDSLLMVTFISIVSSSSTLALLIDRCWGSVHPTSEHDSIHLKLTDQRSVRWFLTNYLSSNKAVESAWAAENGTTMANGHSLHL